MNNNITKIELEDELDLHHFHPKDIKPLLREFLESAVEKEKKQVRVVHGKGQSTAKSIVLKELERSSLVRSFKDDGSNWGATIVYLKSSE